MRVKRNKWDSGPAQPQQAPAADTATPEALRKKAQEAAAKLMAQRQHEQAMCEEIVINDHPINMRDQLTRRAALVSVEQQTGTSIIVKGRYYPPGAPRAPNNPPLLLHITAANHLGMDDITKRIAVSRAAAHIHAILRGQATPMSPVPPHPSNMPLSPPPDMLFRPDAHVPMRPGMPTHSRMQMPPPGYMSSHPQQPMHAPVVHAPPMGNLGQAPHVQQGLSTAPPGPGQAHAIPAHVMPSTSASGLAPPHHQQYYAQAGHDSMAHVPAASPHPSGHAQPPFYGQAPHLAQQPRPNGVAVADAAPGRMNTPGSALQAPSVQSNSALACPQATPPGLYAAGSVPPGAQAGDACTVAVDFSGPPGFDVVQRLRGPANSYISHIERETGASIELRGHGSGSQAGAEQPLHIHIYHPEPWRRKPAEDLIHSLLQTVRAAASAPDAVPMASQAPAMQPHAAQPVQPVPSASLAAPPSGQGQQGVWLGASAVHGHDTAWPAAHGHQPQPVHHQPAAFGGHLSGMQPQMAVRPGQPQPSNLPPGPHQGYQPPAPSKPGFEVEADLSSGMPPKSSTSAGSADLPNARPNTGTGAAAGRQVAGSDQGQGRPQPAKRKFREFKEEAKTTQSRATVLPSYYKHLADDTEGTTVAADASAGDRRRSGELVYGPDGPPEGHSHRAGLGAHRQDAGDAPQQGLTTLAQQPPVGLLVPYDED